MASSSSTPGAGQTIKLADLQIPQLSQLKKQLDEELQHLTQSFASLRAAQGKFRDCLNSLSAGLAKQNVDRSILVPLTASLYVPGKLADTDRVLVDVGTGFFVEKTKEQAEEFYNGKVAELGTSLTDLEKILANKTETVKLVEDVLRQKIVQANNSQEGEASAGAS